MKGTETTVRASVSQYQSRMTYAMLPSMAYPNPENTILYMPGITRYVGPINSTPIN